MPAGIPSRQATWLAGPTLLVLLAALLPVCRRAEDTPEFRDVVVDHSDRAVELVAGREVAQVVIPNHDNLCGVAVVLSNMGRRARTCQVALRLRAKDSAADIAVKTLPCYEVPDEDWVRLDFPPLVATFRQRLVISVESPDARPGEAPGVMMSSVPQIYPDAKLRLGGDVVPGALRFVSYHR